MKISKKKFLNIVVEELKNHLREEESMEMPEGDEIDCKEWKKHGYKSLEDCCNGKEGGGDECKDIVKEEKKLIDLVKEETIEVLKEQNQPGGENIPPAFSFEVPNTKGKKVDARIFVKGQQKDIALVIIEYDGRQIGKGEGPDVQRAVTSALGNAFLGGKPMQKMLPTLQFLAYESLATQFIPAATNILGKEYNKIQKGIIAKANQGGAQQNQQNQKDPQKAPSFGQANRIAKAQGLKVFTYDRKAGRGPMKYKVW